MTNNSQFQIDVGQSLPSSQIREEDLISLFNLWIQKKIVESMNGNSTETASFMTSTTPKYDDQFKRKGSVLVNSNGKHFCTLPRTTSSRKKHKDIQENYGYATYKNGFSTEKLLETIKIDASFASLAKS